MGGIAGFAIIFSVAMIGFSTSFCLTFGTQLYAYRNLKQTLYTLTRALLGDFDFDALVETNLQLGTFLFIIFVCLAVFVILNVLIAIISDAYADTQEYLRDGSFIRVDLEIYYYLKKQFLHMPVIGYLVTYTRKRARRLNKLREQKVKEKLAAIKTRYVQSSTTGAAAEQATTQDGAADVLEEGRHREAPPPKIVKFKRPDDSKAKARLMEKMLIRMNHETVLMARQLQRIRAVQARRPKFDNDLHLENTTEGAL